MNTGINVVSDKLVGVSTQTGNVQIKDPFNASVVKELSPTVAWPVHGVVTLEFGESDLPYQIFIQVLILPTPTGNRRSHSSVYGRTVVYAGEIFWGFGKHIIINNGNNIESIYAHLDKIYVYPGEKVTIPDVIWP